MERKRRITYVALGSLEEKRWDIKAIINKLKCIIKNTLLKGSIETLPTIVKEQ